MKSEYKGLKKALARARSAEIQAIAIYEAEVFWVRDPERKRLLSRILAEEREHESHLSGWVYTGSIASNSQRLVGWMLGSFLAALPWKLMCRVQSWAEKEAALIYRETATRIEALGEGESAELLRALRHAEAQELEHSERFRRE